MAHFNEKRGIKYKKNLNEFFRNVRLGKVDEIRHYIEKEGVDVNTIDAWDNSPLYLACLCGHKAAVEYLLKKGARYGSSTTESQRCFLASLTQGIRDILREYESSLVIDSSHGNITDLKFEDYLQRLFENVPGFDVELIVDGQSYYAHRCILSVRCKYFAQTLDSNASEVLTLSNDIFKSDVFEEMLHFIYTGRMDIEKRQRQEMIALADFLQFRSLSEVLQDKNILMVRHKQFMNDLKTDFGMLVSSALPPSLVPPLEGKPPINGIESYPVKTYPDVVFDVEGQSFKCHKIFFYGRSEYFRELLIDREDEQPPAFGDYLPSIRLKDITASVFQHIVNFVYQNDFELNQENCIPVLKAGTQFIIPIIQKKCMEEISAHIYHSNVLDIYQSAVDLDLPRLKNNCIQYIADELEQMLVFPEFETFIRQQLSPLMKEGKAFEDIPFFMDCQFYIRDNCTTWKQQNAANKKIRKFNYLLTHKIGVDVGLPTFQISDTEPKSVIVDGRTKYDFHREKEWQKRQKEKDCTIL